MRKNGSATRIETENDLGVVPTEIPLSSELDDQQGSLELLRHLWAHRGLIGKVTFVGFVVSLLIAFIIPKTYESTVQLMPPDSQSQNGLALLASISGGGLGGGGLGGVTG